MTHPKDALARSVIPSLASITIHAGIFAALVGITIDRMTTPPPRAARISLESQAPPPQAAPAPQNPDPNPNPKQQTQTQHQPSQQIATQAATQQLAKNAQRPPPPRPIQTAAPALPRPSATPAVSFAGMQSTAATRVVFAVDASGAMVTTFTFIQAELARAIDKLQHTQSFQIILFGDRTASNDGPYRLIPHTGKAGDLIRASRANRTLAKKWINDAIPGGRSNPVPAISAALEFKPDLIFLLARGIQRTGSVSNPDDLASDLSILDTRNPVNTRTGLRPTVIKAVEFIEPDPTGTIARIARIHGDGQGSLRLVTPDSFAGKPDQPRSNQAATTLPESQQTALDLAAVAFSTVRPSLETIAQLTGIATPDEAARVRAAATQALKALADAPPSTRRTADPRPQLMRARAALLLASIEPSQSKRQDLAARVLADTSPLNIADPTLAALRDITDARARIFLDQPEAAHDQLLALIRTAEPTPEQPLTIPLARARLALLDAAQAVGPTTARAARTRDAISKSLEDKSTWPDPTWRTLAAAALTKARLQAGEPTAQAVAPLVAVYQDQSLPTDTRRALAAPRIAHLAGDLADLPLPALRAVADFTSWTGDDARAADLLVRIAALEPDSANQAGAIRDAAFHARAAGRLKQSRDLYFKLAAKFPAHPDAEAALTLALDTAHPTADDLTRALKINPAHPLADNWRLALATQQRGNSGLAVLDAVTDSSQSVATLALDLIDELLPNAATDSERTELLTRAAAQADRLGSTLDPRRRLILARALAKADPDAAVRTLDGLPQNFANSADADRIRLEAAIAKADNVRTFTIARDITNRRTPADGDLYWHALTLWLELGARHGGPDAASAARAHIAGLRQTHPILGGEPWRTRLEALAK